MSDPALHDHPIMKHVRHAIVLNRRPGYHFCGNFFGQVFDDVHETHSTLSLAPALHTRDADGQTNIAAFAMVTDMGLATGIRASLDRATRLATVSLSLQMTGAPRVGNIKVVSVSEGFVYDAAGKQGLSQTKVFAGDDLACFGSGGFMILPPPPGVELHPIPWVDEVPPATSELDPDSVTESEAFILSRAESALRISLDEDTDFINQFLGFKPEAIKGAAHCVVQNGPHIANRVKHVQGGITLAHALITANAALGSEWVLTAAHASYISPGEGETITADSRLIHQGRMTAVVQTKLMSSNGRQVLEVMTNHAKRAA